MLVLVAVSHATCRQAVHQRPPSAPLPQRCSLTPCTYIKQSKRHAAQEAWPKWREELPWHMGPALDTRPAQHQTPVGTVGQPGRLEGHWRAQRRELRAPRCLKNIQNHAAQSQLPWQARAWSASLSGCPSFTDSDVNRNVSCSAILPGALVLRRRSRHTQARHNTLPQVYVRTQR